MNAKPLSAKSGRASVGRVAPRAPLDVRKTARAERRALPLTALAVALLVFALAVRAADAPPEVKLTGIADLGTRTVALLEIKSGRGLTMKPWLVAGEKIESVELTAIDPKKGRASLVIAGKETSADLGSPADSDQPPTLHFKGAGSRQLLDLYQELSGLTVLASPSLPAATLTLKSAPGLGRAASVDALAQAFRDAGIFVTPRHGKYAFATSISHVPRLAQIPDAPAPVKDAPKTETFPPGLLKFSEADVSAVLDIYQELSGRTLLVSPNLPPAKITLKSQTALSREEAVWVLDAMLYLATIKTVPEWTKFTYVLPATRNAAAPKIPDNPAADKLKDSKNSIGPLTLKFEGSSPQQMLNIYAELLGRKPVTANGQLPPTRLNLKSQTALHPVEAIYALDALAALNGLRFVLVGDSEVKIVPAAAGATAGKN